MQIPHSETINHCPRPERKGEEKLEFGLVIAPARHCLLPSLLGRVPCRSDHDSYAGVRLCERLHQEILDANRVVSVRV